MVTNKIEIFHIIHFGLGVFKCLSFFEGRIKILCPKLLESFNRDYFTFLNACICVVNRSVPFLLHFLIDWSNFPGEFFVIKTVIVLRNESTEMIGNLSFLSLVVRVKLERTVDNASVVKSGYNYLLVFIMFWWSQAVITISHLNEVFM